MQSKTTHRGGWFNAPAAVLVVLVTAFTFFVGKPAEGTLGAIGVVARLVIICVFTVALLDRAVRR